MITVFNEVVRETCLDGIPCPVQYEHDLGVFNDHACEWYAYLKKRAKEQGIEITVSDMGEAGSYSYYADTDKEHHFWAHSLDFWEWYQAKFD